MSKYRNAGYGMGWLGMRGEGESGKCRIVSSARVSLLTLEQVRQKLGALSAEYNPKDPEHRRRYAQLKARERSLKAGNP